MKMKPIYQILSVALFFSTLFIDSFHTSVSLMILGILFMQMSMITDISELKKERS
ncbi:hypothetical protein SAMN04490247_3160 [Salimicrobium halophilum]|uniref:Uncharacterized protein n=1 Tax=Salimicrobium halophilum TaxID=86666 RepID=A0A1G8WEH8_9BACI|nr:hypothetical protein SAMN04490247_3160 [Salimicrobium halophilum]